ncbi:MAG: hypothetical protein ABIP03_13850 [Aquihabitans sp.]
MNETIERRPAADMGERFADTRFLRNGGLFFVPDLIWIVFAIATVLVPSPKQALLCIAALSVAWTSTTVKRAGGPYLLPSSVVHLASMVFVGFASYYLSILGSVTSPDKLRVTAMILFSASVVMEIVRSTLLLRWRVVWTGPGPGRRPFRESSPRHFLAKAVLLLAIARLPFMIALNSELANAIGLVGLFMVALAGIGMRGRVRWGGDLLLVIGSLSLTIVWVALVFTGGGRLTVAGLGIAIALIWNVNKPSRWFKGLILLAVPIFMIAAGINRADLIESKYGVTEEGGLVSSGAGLYSVYDPLDRFSTIVLEPGFPGGESIGPRYGATAINALMMPIPRSMWKGKPVGFGSEVTALMAPQMVSIGQSFSVLSFGEGYANFGWAGVALVPLGFGWLMAALDRRHANLVNQPFTTSDDWWRMVALACLINSLGDLYWGGLFTFYTRGGMAFLITIVVWKLSRGRVVTASIPSELQRQATG